MANVHLIILLFSLSFIIGGHRVSFCKISIVIYVYSLFLLKAKAICERTLTLNGWDVRFTRDLNDWELDLMLDFLHILEFNTP